MKEAEICREYKQARKPAMQIGILADLNACEKNDIIRILLLNGIDVTPKEQKKPGKNKDKILEILFSILDEVEEEVKAAEQKYKKIVEIIQEYGKE